MLYGSSKVYRNFEGTSLSICIINQNSYKMKFKDYCMLFLMLCSNLSFAQKTKKVVFVIADGIPLDIIQSHSMPNLNNFSKNGATVSAYVGGEKNGYSETPTICA